MFPYVPPEVMTHRARLYLALTAFYCVGIGLGCLFCPERFGSPAFKVVLPMMPFQLIGWGVAHCFVGVLAGAAAWRGSERYAWRALIGGATLVAPWACGFWIAMASEPTAAPTGAIAYTFICGIHIVQARQPLKSPFEPVLRKLDLPSDK